MKIKVSTLIIILITIALSLVLAFRNGVLKNGVNPFKKQAPAVQNLTQVPAAFPQDLLPEPISPESIQVTDMAYKQQEIKLKYYSLNPLESVLGLYQQVLKTKGGVVTVTSQNSQRVEFKVKQADREVVFTLAETKTNGTEVTVSYLNKIK